MQTGSEDAFSALVSRHLNLVHSVALRTTGDSSAAEEIAQAVFIIFAQKARRLPANVVLSGWFYETARLCAANFLRGASRRQRRDHEAYMDTISDQSTQETWATIAPLLEESMGRLGPADRNAIVLRFFEGRSFAEVATALGATENAAKKRVARGLERLRALLSRRGVNSTTQVLSSAIAAHAVQYSPTGLAAKLSAITFKGHAVMTSTTILVKQVTHAMLMTKIKLASTIATALVIGGAVGSIAFSQAAHQKPSAQEVARQSLIAYAALSSYSGKATIVTDVDGNKSTSAFDLRMQRPSFYRFYGEYNRFWSDGAGDFHSVEDGIKSWTNHLASRQEAFSLPGTIAGAGTASVPAIFFGDSAGDILKSPAAGKDDPRRERDELVDGADCYVISTHALLWRDNQGNSGTTTNRIWIEKNTRLIRKLEQTWDKPTIPSVAAPRRLVSTQTHSQIVANQKFTAADFAN